MVSERTRDRAWATSDRDPGPTRVALVPEREKSKEIWAAIEQVASDVESVLQAATRPPT